MKRIFILSAAVGLFCTSNVFAQSKKSNGDDAITFKKGDKVATIGVSPVSSLGLPVNLGFEVGIQDNVGAGSIGIGGILGYGSRKYSVIGFDYKVSSFVIGVRGNYHYQFVDKLDTYAGLTIGFNAASASYPSNWVGIKQSYGGVIWGTMIGGRYYFTPKVAATLELGYGGIGAVNLGASFKL